MSDESYLNAFIDVFQSVNFNVCYVVSRYFLLTFFSPAREVCGVERAQILHSHFQDFCFLEFPRILF